MPREVETIVTGFVQALTLGEPIAVKRDFLTAIEAIEREKAISAGAVMAWSGAARAALVEMLNSWLALERIAKELGTPVRYPAGFCMGSTSVLLNSQMGAHILRNADTLQKLAARKRVRGQNPRNA